MDHRRGPGGRRGHHGGDELVRRPGLTPGRGTTVTDAPPASEGTAHRYDLGDGGALHYLEFGDRDGPVALVSPGLTDGLAPVFLPDAAAGITPPPAPFARYRVLLVSHRRPLPGGWTTRAMADDLARFVADVAGGPVTFVSHSMGAMVGQHLAGRRHDLVDRLVLSSSLPSADQQFVARLDHWDELLKAGRWYEFHRDALAASFSGDDRDRALADLHPDDVDPPDPELVDRHLRMSSACKTHDAFDVLGAVRCPTLVLAGREDALIRPERARELADAIRGAVLVTIEDAGHALPEQRPEAYAEALRAFLEGP